MTSMLVLAACSSSSPSASSAPSATSPSSNALQPANLQAHLDGVVRFVTALHDSAPAARKDVLESDRLLWTSIAGEHRDAGGDVTTAAGKAAGSHQIAILKTARYPG